jgi:peroxiredoxin
VNRLKSLYVSAYISGSITGLAVALVAVSRADGWSPWLGAALACGAPAAFFARVFAFPTARTSRNLHLVLAVGVAGAAISGALGGAFAAPTVVSTGVGVLGTLGYVYWYSRFAAPASPALSPGAMLPSFTLVEEGRKVESSTLLKKPALWIFYRGNWCPICVAQVKEICGQYRELTRRGVEVFFVSPQSEANTEQLAARCDAPFRFLTDVGNTAAAALGIVERDGLPAGMQVFGYDSDVPRPTAFVTAAGGRVLSCDMTDNYRVRPEPSQFFDILDRHVAATGAP